LPRLISVGRLDFNTEGLLLLTNDGGLARVLELPATGWLRRYRVRAHGSITQEKLDELRDGVTIDGVRYGAIEAALDRLQGSNLWLTFAIREGKKHEVRTVLGHCGLTVNRLIRTSFGPFQLGDLPEGAVEEVRTRVLREQLGERVIALAGADFSAPIANEAVPAARDVHRHAEAVGKRPSKHAAAATTRLAPSPFEARRRGRRAPQGDGERELTARTVRQSKSAQPSHTWRAHDEHRRGKKLRRKFHGARRDEKAREPSAGEARAGLLSDRKGRRVLVERHGQAAEPEPVRQEAPKRSRHRPSFRPDGRHRRPRRGR